MLKKLYFLFLLLLAIDTVAQDFVLVTDSVNPIVSTPPSSEINNPNFAYTGSSWVDVNNDHWIDLFYSGQLFLNQGDGNFSQASGVPNSGLTALTSSSWADFDNDGDADLLYAHPAGGTQVFANDGSGNFTKYTSILDTINSITWSAQWSDYNNDGYTDIILTFAEGFLGANHFPCRLFAGNASGSFSPVVDSSAAFLTELHPYTVSNWIDYDQDGDQDLFIASGPGGVGAALDFIYRNELIETGTASFSRILDEAFAIEPQDGQCYNFIDFDNDGDLDMCLTNWASGTRNRFYINQNGTYVPLPTPFGQASNSNSLSNGWGDLDNDGYIDVIIASNNNIGNYYRNDGQGGFIDAGNIIHGPLGGNTSGLSLGDYDNDGDLDFFTTGLEKGLFRNDLDNGYHSINLALKGGPSNGSALGARVEAKVDLEGIGTWLRREVSAQNTFMGHNSQRIHFGTREDEVIDSLVVYWPSGAVEVHEDLAVDKFYLLEEGKSPSIQFTVGLAPTPGLQLAWKVFPNPSQEFIQIQNEATINENIVLRLYNTVGQLQRQQTFGPSQSIQFPIGDLPSGKYLLQIRTGQEEQTEKIMIE